MADPTDKQLRAIAEGRVAVTIGYPPTYVFGGEIEIDPRALAAELLRLREALRAADGLAEAVDRYHRGGGPHGLVPALRRYRAARGER